MQMSDHNHYQDDRLEKVENKCNSQDVVINGMCLDMATVKSDLSWVKKIQWWVLTFAFSTAVLALINLVMYLLVNKKAL
jgi:type IV secretory pathway component VirB8